MTSSCSQTAFTASLRRDSRDGQLAIETAPGVLYYLTSAGIACSVGDRRSNFMTAYWHPCPGPTPVSFHLNGASQAGDYPKLVRNRYTSAVALALSRQEVLFLTTGHAPSRSCPENTGSHNFGLLYSGSQVNVECTNAWMRLSANSTVMAGAIERCDAPAAPAGGWIAVVNRKPTEADLPFLRIDRELQQIRASNGLGTTGSFDYWLPVVKPPLPPVVKTQQQLDQEAENKFIQHAHDYLSSGTAIYAERNMRSAFRNGVEHGRKK